MAWHVMRFSLGGGQGPSLDEYLNAFGVGDGPPPQRLDVEAEKAKARAIMGDLTAAFQKGAVRQHAVGS